MMSDLLFTLIAREDYAALKTLLTTNDVDLSQKNKFGNTAMHHACRVNDKGNLDIVKLFLSYPHDLESKGIDDFTPLAYAVSVRNSDIAKLLTERGANVNALDNHGNTILFNAVMRYSRKPVEKIIIELLLNNGADPRLKNYYDRCVEDILTMPKNEVLRPLFASGSYL